MAGKIAQGTTVNRETTLGSGVYVAVGNVTSWDGPNIELPEIDMTSLTSTAKEFEGGLIDFGDLSLEVNFDPSNATHQQAIADMRTNPPTRVNWRITFVNPTVNWTWLAFPKGFPTSGRVDDKMTGTLTLRLASDVTVS